MKKKEKILKAFIYLAGAICLYAFIAVRYEPLFNLVLGDKVITNYWDKTKYGELYYFSHINHFKQEYLPPAGTKFQFTNKQSDLNNCDVIAFGDSYFDFSRNIQFPERLHDKLGVKVHYVKGDDILAYLNKNNYQSETEKVLLLERTERWIPLVYSKPQDDTYEIDQRSTLRKSIAKVRDLIFYKEGEKLYDAMLRRSYLTADIYSGLATAKFNFFDYISPSTPKYYLNDTVPWLFYYDQLNDEPTSFYYTHSDKEIDDICINIGDLSNTLWEKYKIRLVFLPLPAKYTLYHTILNDDDYNNFLPRLYNGLEKREICHVNIFQEFKDSEKIVYYGTDEHWQEIGVQIAYDKTIQVFNQDSIANSILFNPSNN